MIRDHLYKVFGVRAEGNSTTTTFLSLARDSIVYVIGALAVGLGNFILIPLYTRSLTPAEFGLYALVDITILILVTITQLGFVVSYLKWFVDLGETRRGELLGSMLILSSLAAVVGGSLLALVGGEVWGAQWFATGDRSFAWMLLPIVVLENIQGLLLNDLRAQRRAIPYATTAVVRLLAIVGSSLWFIVVWHWGLNGVFLGRLVGDAVAVLILGVLCLRSVVLRVSWPLIRPMVRYGLPLVWGTLMVMLMDASGRYFLNHYSALEQVGLYGAAIKISNIFQILIYQPFGLIWGGLMFQIAKWPNAQLVYSKIFAYVFVLALTAALVLAMFTPTLFAIFAPVAYAPAMAVFPLILLMRAVNIMEYPTAIGIYLKSQTKSLALIYTVGFIVSLLANALLVQRYGMFGAAWAWLAGWGTIVALMGWTGHRYYPLQYNWRLFLIPIALWGIVYITFDRLMFELSDLDWVVQIGGALTVLSVVAILLVHDFRVSQRTLRLERAE